MKADRIEDALAALAQGSMVVVVDDEDRENEGDLILAAEHATPERLAFMVLRQWGHLRRPPCRAPGRSQPALDGVSQYRFHVDRLHGDGRLSPRDDDGHFGG